MAAEGACDPARTIENCADIFDVDGSQTGKAELGRNNHRLVKPMAEERVTGEISRDLNTLDIGG